MSWYHVAGLEVRTEALDQGADDFLSKPVEPAELILRVRNVLAARRGFSDVQVQALEPAAQLHDVGKSTMSGKSEFQTGPFIKLTNWITANLNL